jgi:hypothetical protein
MVDQLRVLISRKWEEGIDVGSIIVRVAILSLTIAVIYFTYIYVTFAFAYYRDGLADAIIGLVAVCKNGVVFCIDCVHNIQLIIQPIKQKISQLMGLFVANYFEVMEKAIFIDPGLIPYKNAFNGAWRFLTNWGIPGTTATMVATFTAWATSFCVEWLFPGLISRVTAHIYTV